MKIIGCFLGCLILAFASCGKIPVNKKSSEEAMRSLQLYLQGNAVDVESLFCPSAVYFNGSAVRKPDIGPKLREDFTSSGQLVLKSEYFDPQKEKKLCVYSTSGGSAVLVVSWLRIAGGWNILFMTKGDRPGNADMQSTLKRYEEAYNRHNVKNLFDAFFVDNVCFIQGMTVGSGYDEVHRGLSFVEHHSDVTYSFTIGEQYSLGEECEVTVGRMKPTGTPSVYNFIYVWKTVAGEKRIVAEFDFT